MRRPWLSPFTYAIGMLGMSITAQAFTTYHLFYFVEKLGLAVAFVGIARTIYAIWDAVNDPIFGYLSDRTRTRFGRRRPWMLGALPFYLISFVLVFWVPTPFRQEGRLFGYFLAVIVVYEGFATIMWTNLSALFPELFKGMAQRSRAAAMKHGFQVIGLIIGAALTPLVYSKLGYTNMALVYAALSGILIPLTFIGNREDPHAAEPEPVPIIPAFRETLRNGPFWIYSLTSTLTQFIFGLLPVGMPFYVKYTLGLDSKDTTILLGVTFIVALALVAVWAMLVRRWGGKKSWMTSIAVLGLAVVGLGLATNLMTGLIAGALVGVGLSGLLVTGEILLAHIIDRDYERTGTRREGIYYAVNGFIIRITGALQGLAFWLLTVMYGYVSGKEPGPTPGMAFRFLMSALPLAAVVGALLIARQFPWAVREQQDGQEPRGEAAN